MTNLGEQLDKIVRRELSWPVRLWKKLFPPKKELTVKDLQEAYDKLKEHEIQRS